jgi:hypothetical protein
MSKLSNLKKGELQAIATELGLETEGVKSDIEGRILGHLQGNASLAGDERWAVYLQTSPVKRARKPRASSEDAVDKTETKTEEIAAAAEAVEEELVEKFAGIQDFFYDIYDQIVATLDSVQEAVSTSYAVNLGAVTVEIATLLYSLIPLSRSHFIGSAYPLPYFELVTAWRTLWLPLILWVSVAVVLPGVISHFVNFRLAAASHSRRKSTRARATPFDPLVFSVARAVSAWIFLREFTFVQPLNVYFLEEATMALNKALPIVVKALGDVPFVIAFVAIVFNLYEAALA